MRGFGSGSVSTIPTRHHSRNPTFQPRSRVPWCPAGPPMARSFQALRSGRMHRARGRALAAERSPRPVLRDADRPCGRTSRRRWHVGHGVPRHGGGRGGRGERSRPPGDADVHAPWEGRAAGLAVTFASFLRRPPRAGGADPCHGSHPNHSRLPAGGAFERLGNGVTQGHQKIGAPGRRRGPRGSYGGEERAWENGGRIVYTSRRDLHPLRGPAGERG